MGIGVGKITYEFIVHCGRCGRNLHLTERTHDLNAQWLRGEGWSQTKDEGWVCPGCAAERKLARKERRARGLARAATGE
jgi:hypothetical protein